MRIQAAVMDRPDGTLTRRRIAIEDVDLEDPRPDEVLVRVTSCGVCGTDRGCIHGLEPYPTPGVLGHEGVGVVESVGREVQGFEVGDHVLMAFPYCGACRSCRRGDPRYCEHGFGLVFSGHRLDGTGAMSRPDGTPLAGRFFQQSSWSTWTIALGRQLVKIPDGLDPDLCGPYGCSVSTGAGAVLNELRPFPGSSIAVFGAGNVGLAAIMASRLSGATRIIAVDKVRSRLDLALELGATDVLEHGPDTVPQIKAMVGDRLDYSIEATNGANLVSEAVLALGIRGTCAMLGGAKPAATVTFSHPDFLLHGKRLIGVMGGSGHTPGFLEALMILQRDGRFPLERLVRFYDFADVNAAIDDSDAGDAVKPILRMPG